MAQAGSLEKLYQKYKGQVAFLLVYVSEAHPGSVLAVPGKDGKTELHLLPQTSSVAERMTNLKELISITHVTIPAVLDDELGSARHDYAAWPDRIYVIGTDGKVAFKSRPGPFGFRVPELADWLRTNVQ